MTPYEPNVSRFEGSKAERLERAIAADIADGVLEHGRKLPTHRDLAHTLGMTAGTISRAYIRLARRGLISSEVGRGTFVQRKPFTGLRTELGTPQDEMESSIDLAVNRQPSPEVQRLLADAFQSLSTNPRVLSLMTYQPDTGTGGHREAFADWLADEKLVVHPGDLVVTAGALHAIYVVLKAFTRPGDIVLTEEFTYAGFKALASELQLRIEPVAMDEHGLIPESLEERAAQSGAKWLYFMPGLHNPTAAVMPEERRQAVLAIAERHGLMLIEDGVYAFVHDHALPPVASLARERTFYVSSLSKSVAPGLRAGCVAAPPQHASRVAAVIRRSMWMTPPLGLEIAAQWIRDGDIKRLISLQRNEFRERRAIAETMLEGMAFRAPAAPAFIWLELPERVRSHDIVAIAEEQGVSLAPTDAFATKRSDPDRYLRISLNSCRSIAELSTGLSVVANAARGSLSRAEYYY
ncbi:aminotransferase-like domain-containing protein [Mesorhizobium comanense]|uniref:aminotransferase-like domain-containing protein n=1 Tax=Mesorhizobium comanense TaxID=2502215 RepID=UPI0010F5A5A6|nr:PLP-dependent aminotransferase family protein [Mesorhizobium comanense]